MNEPTYIKIIDKYILTNASGRAVYYVIYKQDNGDIISYNSMTIELHDTILQLYYNVTVGNRYEVAFDPKIPYRIIKVGDFSTICSGDCGI